ncbi:MAG: flagellar motor switch protein FliN [Spirochaetota bacterium]
MGDGSLSQDEIDALLQGADDMLSGTARVPAGDFAPAQAALSPVERESVADFLNSSMGSVMPALSGYLGKNIIIGNALVEVKSADQVRAEFPKQYVQIVVNFSGGVNGKNVILLSMNDAGVISSLMMGDDSGTPPGTLTEAHQSTLQEFVSQMMSTIATQLSNKIGKGVNTTAPDLKVVQGNIEVPGTPDVVKVTYNLTIQNLINSKMYQLMNIELAGEIARGAYVPQMQQPEYRPEPAQPRTTSQVGISPVRFPPLGEGMQSIPTGNINLLLDVPMTLTVELGRTRQLVKDILGLGEGSIIELDKLAGEPVDLLVNGKLIARGEVVVIDENFGVRVTDIVSPAERIAKMQS